MHQDLAGSPVIALKDSFEFAVRSDQSGHQRVRDLT